MALREESHDGQKIQDNNNDAKLEGPVVYFEAPDRFLNLRTKNTYSWLAVRGTTVTGTLLAAT